MLCPFAREGVPQHRDAHTSLANNTKCREVACGAAPACIYLENLVYFLERINILPQQLKR